MRPRRQAGDAGYSWASRLRRIGGSRARSQARRLSLHRLYQWQLSRSTAAEISAQLLASQKTRDTDTKYFKALLGAAIADSNTLEALFGAHLDRPLAQLRSE